MWNEKSGAVDDSAYIPRQGRRLTLHEIACGVLCDASTIGRAGVVRATRYHEHDGGDNQYNDECDDFSE